MKRVSGNFQIGSSDLQTPAVRLIDLVAMLSGFLLNQGLQSLTTMTAVVRSCLLLYVVVVAVGTFGIIS